MKNNLRSFSLFLFLASFLLLLGSNMDAKDKPKSNLQQIPGKGTILNYDYLEFKIIP